MASIDVQIHPATKVRWGKFSDVVGDVITLKHAGPPPDNGQPPAEPHALVLTDIFDGECHVFVFTDEGKQELLKELTGGVIIP